MNIGEFKDRITILALNQIENTYSWEDARNISSKAERLKGNNIFSKVGLGAKSIKFIIRKRKSFSYHNALRWQGKHCFITDIVEIERMYYEVTAALIEPHICTVIRTGKPVRDSLNRPIYNDSEHFIFPGYLTEKYLSHTQEIPMASTEIRYVLVTPKPINLVSGETVEINKISYTVLIPHTLDEYKNEYEILVKEDV